MRKYKMQPNTTILEKMLVMMGSEGVIPINIEQGHFVRSLMCFENLTQEERAYLRELDSKNLCVGFAMETKTSSDNGEEIMIGDNDEIFKVEVFRVDSYSDGLKIVGDIDKVEDNQEPVTLLFTEYKGSN